jgi:hypothetical protein
MLSAQLLERPVVPIALVASLGWENLSWAPLQSGRTCSVREAGSPGSPWQAAGSPHGLTAPQPLI